MLEQVMTLDDAPLGRKGPISSDIAERSQNWVSLSDSRLQLAIRKYLKCQAIVSDFNTKKYRIADKHFFVLVNHSSRQGLECVDQ